MSFEGSLILLAFVGTSSAILLVFTLVGGRTGRLDARIDIWRAEALPRPISPQCHNSPRRHCPRWAPPWNPPTIKSERY